MYVRSAACWHREAEALLNLCRAGLHILLLFCVTFFCSGISSNMLCEADEEDYSSDDDEDYLPSGESSGGESGEVSAEDEDPRVKGQGKAKVKTKRKRLQTPETKRRRTGGIQLENDDIATATRDENGKEDMANVFKEEEHKAAEVKKEEQEQKKADDLWSSFLQDVGQKPKVKPQDKAEVTSSSKKEDLSQKECSAKSGVDTKVLKDDRGSAEGKKMVTVTKIFDFAGETVKVTEEVAADSKEAKKLSQPSKPAGDAIKPAGDAIKPSASQASAAGPKRPAGGLSSVLGLINKKPKMSVLEKSRLDWNNFTAAEGIVEDLKLHNRGKEGYVEKQKFLANADQRQYEKEREVRMGQSKR